jgi:hypothetical protein
VLLELLIEQENISETSFEVQNITYTSPIGDGANVNDGSKGVSYIILSSLSTMTSIMRECKYRD